MNSKFWATTAGLVATFALATQAHAQCVQSVDGSGTQCGILYAGQTIEAGTVCTSLDANGDMVVSYETTGGWELEETHVWAGTALADMPQTRKGAPKIGNFPYQSGDITGATSWSITISLEDIAPDFACPGDDQNVFFSAHAALRKLDETGGYQTETGWIDGDRFVDRGTWATFATVTLTCDCDGGGGGGGGCETAFAFAGEDDSVCFIGTDFDGDGVDDGINRWGWSNGPLGAGSYSFEIYQAAGQCKLSNGSLVGHLSVVYDGSKATVTYNADIPYTWDEVHLYVGSEPLASDVNDDYTVAPGQYPIVVDLTEAVTYTTSVTGLSGDIYLVAHAVSCEP